MARKSSDLFTLLASRGRAPARRRSGGGGGGFFRSFFGSTSQDVTAPRKQGSSGLALAAVAFLCLGVGYLLGDTFPMTPRAWSPEAPRTGTAEALRAGPAARPGQRPGPVAPVAQPQTQPPADDGVLRPEVEVEPLTNQAFFLVAYEEDHRALASDLARKLRVAGIRSARPYRVWMNSKNYWTVAAYYDGAKEKDELRQKLLQVPAPEGHPKFESSRKLVPDWPPARDLK